MSWQSIDESEPVVLLRGRPALAERGRPWRLTPALLALFLQRSISWTAALTAHVVAAALLISIWVQTRVDDDALVAVSLHRGHAGTELKAPPAPEPPKAEPRPEPPAPEPAEPEPEPPKPEPVVEKPKEAPAPKPAEPETSPSPVPAAAADVPAPKPATIGGGASAAGKPASGGDGSDQDVEKDPTAALLRRRAGELARLRGGAEKDIVVVTGAYDHVEQVLGRLGIPHTVVEPDRLPDLDLGECMILLINCHVNYAAYLFGDVDTAGLEKQIVALGRQEDVLVRRIGATKDPRTLRQLEFELIRTTSGLTSSRQQLEALRSGNRMVSNVKRFVDGGGYLFTSDWGLSLIAKAFPGYVRNGGNVGPRTVTIRPRSSESRNTLLDGVFYDLAKGNTTTMRKFRWGIDSSSYLIRVDRPGAVDILVESSEIPKHPAVAVTFQPEKHTGTVSAGPQALRPATSKPEPGKGRVLHILSHFDKQATQQGDYALQSMLLNFMLERVK